jgi:hypothetical protein
MVPAPKVLLVERKCRPASLVTGVGMKNDRRSLEK